MRCTNTGSEPARNGRWPGTSSRSSRPSRPSETRRSRARVAICPGSASRRSTSSTPRMARRPWASSSTGAHSCSPTTSCSAPTTRSAPVERLTAYKQRMGWQFPYVSTYNSDFAFDFGLALTEEQAQQVPEVKEMIDNPPEFLKEWSPQIGAEVKDGLRENPSWIAFARENGTVYHPYTVSAPDPFVAPYFNFLLERTPKEHPSEPRTWRKDEYPD